MNKYRWMALAVVTVSFTVAGACLHQGLKAMDLLTEAKPR